MDDYNDVSVTVTLMVMECHGHGYEPTMLDGLGNEGSWSRTVNVTLRDGHCQSDERSR
jgi:hypothetical protein